MKKSLFLGAAAGLALLFCGCSSVETATPAKFNGQAITTAGTPLAHVSATTRGLYLFTIPLIVGSAENIGMPTAFQNTVNPTTLANMVTSKSKALGATRVIDLNTSSSSVGFIFYMRAASASCNAIR